MNNSLVTHLRGYVHAVFDDIRWAYSHDRDWIRDKTRLLHELEAHGLRIVTLDLPALSKHFRKCLDKGLYLPSGLYLSQPRKGTRSPKFLGNLIAQIFDESGMLRCSPSIPCINIVDQVYTGLSKLKLQCSRKAELDEVNNYHQVEVDCRSPSLSWDGDSIDVGNPRRPHFRDVILWDERHPQLPGIENDLAVTITSHEADTLQQVCDRVSSSLGDFHSETPTERPKHGPGVVSNHKRTVSKYTFPEWPEKLNAIFPHDLYATSNLGDVYRTCPETTWKTNESPSRLIAVPKTLKSPRLIAAEPSQHQWIQQLIRHQLEARVPQSLISHSVCFRSQLANQTLAKLGSSDGYYVTIDLSSASDRLSCWTVERAFRSNWTLLERLHASRTRWIRDDLHPTKGGFFRLKKFASQGSACTFPVQTLVYASASVASVLISRGWKVTSANIRRASRQVQVFGDDIIVPKDSCEVLFRVLSYLGLKVNHDKSFTDGKYRESCGVSAYDGTEVTPCYYRPSSAKPSMSNLQSHLEVGNNFHRAGYWHVSSWIRSYLAKWDHLIPFSSKDDNSSSHYSFCGEKFDHLRSRFSDSLHRIEYRMLVPYSTKQPLFEMSGEHRMFQYFTERPSPDEFWESGVFGVEVSSMRPGWKSTY